MCGKWQVALLQNIENIIYSALFSNNIILIIVATLKPWRGEEMKESEWREAIGNNNLSIMLNINIMISSTTKNVKHMEQLLIQRAMMMIVGGCHANIDQIYCLFSFHTLQSYEINIVTLENLISQ
jgi:hypothetical protein